MHEGRETDHTPRAVIHANIHNRGLVNKGYIRDLDSQKSLGGL